MTSLFSPSARFDVMAYRMVCMPTDSCAPHIVVEGSGVTRWIAVRYAEGRGGKKKSLQYEAFQVSATV